MFEHCRPQGALHQGRDFGSLVVFALLQSQRRSFDSLCPRQLLPVISFTKGLLPRTPVNQQKLYIHRKHKPSRGSRGAWRGSAHGGSCGATAGPACAHRCSSPHHQPGFLCFPTPGAQPHAPFPREHGQLGAVRSDLGHESRKRSLPGRAGAEGERKAGF